MPIYTPEEYPAVIERIKTKIAQKNISMGPTISETEIAAFESACNTRLPQAYRLFLLEVGDGWNDPAAEGIASPIHRLAEIEHKDLSLPMTLTDAGFGRMRRTKSSLATSPLNVSWGTRVLSSWMRGVA